MAGPFVYGAEICCPWCPPCPSYHGSYIQVGLLPHLYLGHPLMAGCAVLASDSNCRTGQWRWSPAPLHSPPSPCTSQNGQGPSHGPSVDHHHPWSVPASLPPLPSGAALASGLDLVVGTGLTLSVGPGRPDGRGRRLCSTPAQVIPFPGPSLGDMGRWLPHAMAKDMEDTKPQSEAQGGPAAWLWPPGTQLPAKPPRRHWGLQQWPVPGFSGPGSPSGPAKTGLLVTGRPALRGLADKTLSRMRGVGVGARDAAGRPASLHGAGRRPQSMQRLPRKTYKHTNTCGQHTTALPSVSELVQDNICSEPKPDTPASCIPWGHTWGRWDSLQIDPSLPHHAHRHA